MDALRFAPVPILLVAFLVFLSPAVAQTCTQVAPHVDMSPSHISVLPGERAVYTVEVDNRDPDNCPTTDFVMSGTSGIGTVSFNPSVLSIKPGDSETSLMTVRAPSDAAVGEYQVVARSNNGVLLGDDAATLEVLEDIESCEVKVSNLRFKERTGDEFKDEFAPDDEVSVIVDVSLLGNVASDVLVQLFVEGAVLDSETDNYPANSDTTLRFSERILTKNYVDNIDVRVVATPDCNPANSDDDGDRIEIIEGDEDLDIEISVGTPSNTVVGREVASRIFVDNVGGDDVRINLDARLCLQSGGCVAEMFCGGDSRIIIDKDDTEEIICRYTPTVAGTYRVEASVTFDVDQDIERSNYFTVAASESELASATPGAPVQEQTKIREVVYTCSGDVRQAVYTTATEVKTSDVEFCPFGCSQGRCLQTAAPAKTPVTSVIPQGSGEGGITAGPIFNPPAFGISDFFSWLKNLLFGTPNLE